MSLRGYPVLNKTLIKLDYTKWIMTDLDYYFSLENVRFGRKHAVAIICEIWVKRSSSLNIGYNITANIWYLTISAFLVKLDKGN